MPHPPPRKNRLTMRRQALIRLAGVMLILIVGISLIGADSFYTRQKREIEQKLDTTRAFYAETVPRLEAQWATQAEQTRVRIEYTRILEEDQESMRWARLNTFLTAQWEFVEFSNLVVLSPQGEALYRYGTEGTRLPITDKAISGGWYFSSETQELYRIFQLPIWLGNSGQGKLVLFKSFNSATLQNLLIPETHLHLHYLDRLVANSDPYTPAEGRPGEEGLHTEMVPQVIQVDHRWGDSPLAPILLIHREFKESISLLEFMLRPLAAIILVAIMIWLGLGRWLTRSVKRIEALEVATHQYAGGGSIEEASRSLAPAHTTHDEIDDVADSLETMMHQVHARDIEQRTYLETLAILEEAVLELDRDGRILHASPGWYRLTRCPDNLQGVSITEFIHQDDVEAMRNLRTSFQNLEKSQALLRMRLRNDSGSEQWAECRLIAQLGSDGKLSGIRGVLRDITQTYLHEQQITHMALHDALTDLPNRILLEDRIKIATRMASRGSHRVAICFIDLDHFKKINDSLGHKAGDRLLTSFAATLRDQLRNGDTLARWGGDEFVMLLPELASEEAVRTVVNKIEQALKVPIRLEEGNDYVVTFSMGVAMYPDDALDVEGLLSHADRAMFYAKTQGRNQTCFFGEVADKGGGKRELYIQNKLVEAVTAGRIQAWFQPIIDAKTGECAVVEVLARWHDSEFGWVSPATFIPIAENTGAIRELGYQIWQQTLAAMIEWRERGRPVRAAINVSKRQLFSNQFAEQLVGELATNDFSPESVIIEVTESVALLDVTNASERLSDLHHIGFHIAIDDFGTGYSALSQLHEMPVDELKIDISFVRRLHEPAGYSMVQAIIHLAKALGLKTIAEGVEDEATATLLRTLGADYLQGYHFAKPMPGDEFATWLFGKD